MKCLVVDDSRVVRTVSRRILEELGMTCEEAEDGQKAFEHCLKSMPDAVMIDWNMPVMNGYDFVIQLRKSPGGTKPKIIFCSTENGAQAIKRALSAGADEYIMKPFDIDIIQSKLALMGLIDS